MAGFLARRIIQSVVVLLAISIATFLIVRLAPGGPEYVLADVNLLSDEQLAAIRAQLGLEEPLHIQYFETITSLFSGELRSFRTGQTTVEIILNALPVSLMLMTLTIVIAVVLGIALGVFSAVFPYTKKDEFLTTLALLALSIPQFWLGLMAIVVFSVNLKWLPASGLGPIGSSPDLLTMAKHMILPTLVLSANTVAWMSRYTRSSMLENLAQDYVRAARAKGLRGSRVLLVHALKNSLITVISLVGLLVPILISATVVVETVFGLPGMGRAIVTAALERDYPVVFATNIVAAVLVLGTNLLVDVLYMVVDPRIELKV